MNLGDFFAGLSYGELNNIKVGMEGEGAIDPTDQARVTHYTNSALTLLHSKFSHKQDYVNIKLIAGRKKYPLRTVHNVSNLDPGNTEDRFIQDSTTDQYAGDLIKIISVVAQPTADEPDVDPYEVVLNNTEADAPFRTTTFDTLYIEEPVVDQILTIEYQVNHSKLTMPPNLLQEIELAPVLHEALEAKVAARVYGTMNGEAHIMKSQLLNAQFEEICALVKQEDLLQETRTALHSKFSDRGFV